MSWTQPTEASNEGLVVFVLEHCPFCTRVKILLAAFGVTPRIVNIEDPANSAEYAAMVEKTHHDTLPLVAFNGELVGGCDDVCFLADSGALQRRFNLPTMDRVSRGRNGSVDIPPVGFLNFPPFANRWVSQMIAIQVVTISAIVIAFRKEYWAWWVTLGMALDFSARFVFGGSASMLGATATFAASFLDEQLVPGPPKQFAAFVGTFFFGLATILFHVGEGSDVSLIGAPVVVGCVLGASSMEAFFNFCIGCWMFGRMNKLGLVSDAIYQPYTDSYRCTWRALVDYHKRQGWQDAAAAPLCAPDARPAGDPALFGWQRKATDTKLPRPVTVNAIASSPAVAADVSPIDIRYKYPKTDSTIAESCGLEYIQFSDFAAILGISGFAMVLRSCNSIFRIPPEAWQFTALFAASLYGLMLLCLVYKVVRFPRKVYMDLQHPFKRQSLAVLAICNLLFSSLARDDDDASYGRLQAIMWWSGTVPTAIIMVVSLAAFTKNRHTGEHMTPALLFAPAASLVVALVTPGMATYHPHLSAGFNEVALWFAGFGFLFFGILLTSSLLSGATYHWSDERLRPLVALWGGSCFIASLSWMSINRLTSFDAITFVFFASGVLFFLQGCYLVFPSNWLLRGRFDMANWGLAFPLDVAALAGLSYYNTHRHPFSLGVCWVLLVCTGFANFTCLFHTLALLVNRKFPAPATKFGPLTFNKLQHEAMRELLAVIGEDCRSPVPSGGEANATLRLKEQLKSYLTLQNAHADYEEAVLFPELKAFNTAQINEAEDQHAELHKQLHNLEAAVEDSNLERMRETFLVHVDGVLDHMQYEEDHMQPIIRKGLTLAVHCKIMENVWDRVSPADMEQSVVTCVRYLPLHGQRIRFLKAITWALPDRAQLLGTWLYRGLGKDPLGDVKISLIFEDMPELAPRGAGVFLWTKIM